MMIAALPAFEVALRLGTACVVGAAIGIDREMERKAAGLRTHILLALGAAVFLLMVAGPGTPQASVARVLQGLVSGLGFLSAGQILRHRLPIGVTTAADLWVVGALGAACGLGFYGLALVVGGLVVVVLRVLGMIEGFLWRRRAPRKRDAPAERS